MMSNSDKKALFKKLCKNPVMIGLLLTVAILMAYHQLPEKRRIIYPSFDPDPQIYGFIDARSGISAQWVDWDLGKWVCDYKVGHSYGCGWNLYWDPLTGEGLNLSTYHAVEITMDYEGPASRIRFFMRNYNEEYAHPNNIRSAKFMSVTFPVEETEGPILLSLSELSVARWWLQEQNIRRRWASPEFGHIISVGVDFIEPGVHHARVTKIVLVGEWVRKEYFLFGVLAFWMTLFLLEGLLKSFRLYKTIQRERSFVRTLESKQHILEEEKKALGILADTDPLTGVANRSGLYAQMDKWRTAPDDGSLDSIGLLLLDIDHFKQLNDSYGHDMGDKILKAFAAAVSANLREEDVFARWGGEEFVILCRNRSLAGLQSFAEKLRLLTQQFIFGAEAEISITVSIGVTLMRREEAFEESLKRADKALYIAKEKGRNRIECDGLI